jgi:hypothetical protein
VRHDLHQRVALLNHRIGGTVVDPATRVAVHGATDASAGYWFALALEQGFTWQANGWI